jgi:hypothetical protein
VPILLLVDKLTFSNVVIVLLTNIIIDSDHLIRYAFFEKPFTIKEYKKHQKEHYKTKHQRLYLFHTLEFLVLLIYLALLNDLFFILFIGFLIHWIGDLVVYIKAKKGKDLLPWTITYHIWSNRK